MKNLLAAEQCKILDGHIPSDNNHRLSISLGKPGMEISMHRVDICKIFKKNLYWVLARKPQGMKVQSVQAKMEPPQVHLHKQVSQLRREDLLVYPWAKSANLETTPKRSA